MSRVGKYERQEREITCTECGDKFIVKQIKTYVCRKCQRRINNRRYYEKNKHRIKPPSKEDKRRYNLTYYKKHSDKITERQREYYKENREDILEYAEKYRRERGVLPNGMSGTEEVALEILEEMYPKEEIRTNDRKTILNPNTGHYLELDYYLPNINIAIELNGITHYEPVYGEEKFKRQLINDTITREVCKELGITLIEVPLEKGVHYERTPAGKAKLKELITRFLRFREDKSPERCTIEDHLGGN